MKTAKSICATILLALSLSISTFAEDNNPGEIHTPGRAGQITCDDGSQKPGEPCLETPGTSDGNFSDFMDIVWVVTSLF